MTQDKLRVIVCGGRDFSDRSLLHKTLDRIHLETPIGHLWHGNASGADTLADWWAKQLRTIAVHPVPAQWSKFGRAAGPKRNEAMLGNEIDLVIAFPGGRGTADMIRRAQKRGVRVIKVGGVS